MKKLIILTDEASWFHISRADTRNFTSMDIDRIRNWFSSRDYEVFIYKFSEFDMSINYKGWYILYQTSESPGGFYKRYIEDLVYTLEERGAILLPVYKYLKAHHDKIFMEYMRLGFRDESLKSIRSTCYGSWVDALNFDRNFPVVIKQASGSAGKKVFLVHNKSDYKKYVKKAGKTLVADSLTHLVVTEIKNIVKRVIKNIYPSKRKYIQYNTDPVSSPVIIQNFIPGFDGDFRVLFFGGKYYCMHRGIRRNDFRASGSGQFSDVKDEHLEGLLDFARRLTYEIDFPILGMDIGFDGNNYHLIEYQMINFGTSALQRSFLWHEYQDGRWVRCPGRSVLEDEFARSIDEFIINSLDYKEE
ncbi:MAG: hypothetical protein GX180_05275 [Enterococcus sp.]|nr:hypothetical protein [Enterococcus sp.]